jgi:hypothetical protein
VAALAPRPAPPPRLPVAPPRPPEPAAPFDSAPIALVPVEEEPQSIEELIALSGG